MEILTAEQFQELASVEIQLKSGEKLTYRLVEEELGRLATDYEQAILQNRKSGRYSVYTLHNQPRTLVLDLREVRYIG